MLPRKLFDAMLMDVLSIPELAGKEADPHKKGTYGLPVKLRLACCLYKYHKNIPWGMFYKLANISASPLERWSDSFLRLYTDKYYDRDVHPPQSEQEIQTTLMKHDLMGQTGCLNMWDGVHIEWPNCPSGDKWKFQGKEGYPTVAFLIAGDGNGLIHECSQAHPGTSNDLIMCHYSPLAQSMNTGVYATRTFELLKLDGSRVRVQGLYGITDAGLHKWRIFTQPVSAKMTVDIWDKRLSKRQESVRKPGSECIFRIMKKRIPSLMLGVHHMTLAEITHFMKFCCMLHNQIMHANGRSTIGEYEGDWIHVNLSRDDMLIERGSNAVRPVRFTAPYRPPGPSHQYTIIRLLWKSSLAYLYGAY